MILKIYFIVYSKMEINHKIDNQTERIKEQETKASIQRPKKPRSQAQIDATKKMLEGRKEWATNKGKENKAKKVAKLKAKIAKIDPTDEVEDVEVSDLSVPLEEPTTNNLLSEEVICDPPLPNEVDDIEDTKGNVSKSKPKGKKKKTIVNNYHYTAEEDSSDEEVINNHYIPPKKTKKKPKRRVKIIEPESESSEEEEEYEQQYIPQPKIGIRFV